MSERIDDTESQLSKFSREIGECIDAFKNEPDEVLIKEVLKIALIFPVKQDYPNLANRLLEYVVSDRYIARAFQFEQLTSMTRKFTDLMDREMVLKVLPSLATSMSLYFWEDKSDNANYMNDDGSEFPLKDIIIAYNNMSIKLIGGCGNEELLETYIKDIEALNLSGVKSRAGDIMQSILNQEFPEIALSADHIFLKANMRAMYLAKEELYALQDVSSHYFEQAIVSLVKRYSSVTEIANKPFQNYSKALVNGGNSILVSYTYNSLFLFLSQDSQFARFLNEKRGDIGELIEHITICSRLGNDAIGYISRNVSFPSILKALEIAFKFKDIKFVHAAQYFPILEYSNLFVPRMLNKVFRMITGAESHRGKITPPENITTEILLNDIESFMKDYSLQGSTNAEDYPPRLRNLLKEYCAVNPTKASVFKKLMPMQYKDIIEENEFNTAANADINPFEDSLEIQFSKYRQNLKSMNANFFDSFAMFIAGSIALQVNNGGADYPRKGSVVAAHFRQFPLWMFEEYLDGKDFDK
jgi:hypothetical protein